VQVVDRGGFTAQGAATHSKSTLSHRLQELEKSLGRRLLIAPHAGRITDAGSEFYRHAVATLREAEQAETAMAPATHERSGRRFVHSEHRDDAVRGQRGRCRASSPSIRSPPSSRTDDQLVTCGRELRSAIRAIGSPAGLDARAADAGTAPGFCLPVPRTRRASHAGAPQIFSSTLSLFMMRSRSGPGLAASGFRERSKESRCRSAHDSSATT